MPAKRSPVKRFTSKEYLDALEKIGWLAALPADARRELGDRVTRAKGGASTDLCPSLAAVTFDAEMIYGQGPRDADSYHGLIKLLADGSFGQFKPTKIKDTLSADDERAYVSFELGKRAFSINVPLRNDWVEMDVIDVLVNDALRDTGIASRFRRLPASDQTCSLAFVPDDVWRKAVEAGLIPADRVDPLRERKPCSEKELAARLPPGEGVPGLHEWTGQLRDAIVAEVRASGFARITIGLGKIGVRAGREPGKYKLSFHPAQVIKNIVNDEPADLEDGDDVVTAIVALLRERYDEFPLHGIGKLRVRPMAAFTGSNPLTGEAVEIGAKNMIELDFDPALRAELHKPSKSAKRARR